VLILFQRAARPDASLWRGRRLLAAVDALVWPALWVAVALAEPFGSGIVGVAVVACALFSAATRLHQAICQNERYEFTTWRWGRPLIVLVAIGAVVKVALAFLSH